jgi:NADH-quinone oxidoreductase subunit L
MYVQGKGKPAAQLAEKWPGLKSFLADKWRVDEFYQETIIGAVDSLAEICVWADRWIVDGILARFSAFVVQVSGSILRQFQTGRLQTYGAVMTVGLVAVGCYVVVPQDNVRITEDHATGTYTVQAAPGFGYGYRWDADGDESGEWDNERFGPEASKQFSLERNTTRVVRLQVENVFGHVNEEKFEFVRPAEDFTKGSGETVVIERGADGQLRPRGAGATPPPRGTLKQVPPGKQRPPGLQQLQKDLQKGGDDQ